jgi:hypothetical protein
MRRDGCLAGNEWMDGRRPRRGALFHGADVIVMIRPLGLNVIHNCTGAIANTMYGNM